MEAALVARRAGCNEREQVLETTAWGDTPQAGDAHYAALLEGLATKAPAYLKSDRAKYWYVTGQHFAHINSWQPQPSSSKPGGHAPEQRASSHAGSRPSSRAGSLSGANISGGAPQPCPLRAPSRGGMGGIAPVGSLKAPPPAPPLPRQRSFLQQAQPPPQGTADKRPPFPMRRSQTTQHRRTGSFALACGTDSSDGGALGCSSSGGGAAVGAGRMSGGAGAPSSEGGSSTGSAAADIISAPSSPMAGPKPMFTFKRPSEVKAAGGRLF